MLEISNPDKVLFPDAGITKRQLAEYYMRVAERLLPHVAGRPLVLQRFPDGIDHPGFFQKNTPDHVPDTIGRVEIEKVGGGTTEYAVIDDEDGLVYLAGQASVALHTLLARAAQPERPIEIVFDLDPSGTDLEPVRQTAGDLRELLDDLGLAPRVKSSGSRGLHVVVDVIDADADFDLTKAFSRDVARYVAERRDDVTTEQRKEQRRGRLFLDVLRNSPANHAVAPYSVRALPSAPIAAPLEWDEALANSFEPQRFTIDNIFRRLGQRDDPWASAPRPSATIADAQAALGRAP